VQRLRPGVTGPLTVHKKGHGKKCMQRWGVQRIKPD